MDVKSMKLRELQTLCKKQQGLPVNSTNSQMALSMASLLQNPQRITRGCLKGSGRSVRKDSRLKKVTFALEEEKFEFEKKSLGKPETRRSTRRASIRVHKIYEKKAGSVETSPPRVPEFPARITRSRASEFVPKNMDLECDQKEKGKECCVVESNIRILRSRVLVVGGNEGRLRRNQKQGRRRRNAAGKQEEDNVDVCLNLKLGQGEVYEKKTSRKRSRVAEAPPCEEPRLRR